MASKSLTRKAMRARAEAQVAPRLGLRALLFAILVQAALAAALAFLYPAAVRAEPMLKGTISVTTDGGYARLVFRFPEENEADVKLANGIIIVRFKKPVEVATD